MDAVKFLSNPLVNIPLSIVLSLLTALIYDVLKSRYKQGSPKRLKAAISDNIELLEMMESHKGRHILMMMFLKDAIMLLFVLLFLIFLNIVILTQLPSLRIAQKIGIEGLDYEGIKWYIKYVFAPMSFLLYFFMWIFIYRVFYYWTRKFPRILNPVFILKRITKYRDALGEQNVEELVARLEAYTAAHYEPKRN
jgi:hypothetical protein